MTDTSLILLINSFFASSSPLSFIAIFIADDYPYVLGLVLIYLGIKSKKWLRIVLISILSSVFAFGVIKQIILLFVERARPYVTLYSIHPLISLPDNQMYESMPSSHTLAFFALSTVIYTYNKHWGIFFFVSSATIAFARIAVGVHYPTDILAGAVLGIFYGLIILFITKKIEKIRNKKEK